MKKMEKKILIILGVLITVGVVLKLVNLAPKKTPSTKKEVEKFVKEEGEKAIKEAFETSQNKKGVFDLSQVKTYKKIGEEFEVDYQRRIYDPEETRTLKGKASYKITETKKTKKVGMWEAGTGEEILIVYLEVKGDSGNEGYPLTFDQTGTDPSPQFFLVDDNNKRYNMQTAEAKSAAREAGRESLMSITMTTTNWTKSTLAFIVPENIKKPTLVLSSLLGGDKYSYVGVRLD